MKSIAQNDTPWTPAVPLFLALREALLLLKEETLEGRLARAPPGLPKTCAACDVVGLELFPDRAMPPTP